MKWLSNPYRVLIAILFSAIIVNFSCKKEKSQGLSPSEEVQANRNSTEADAESEDIFNGLFDDAMGVNNDVGMAGTGIFGRGSGSSQTGRVDTVFPCVLVTVVHLSTTAFPVKVILDFGTGCVGRDGHFRKGKIITNYSNRLVNPGATAVSEFENFYIDSNHIEGRHEITNTTATNSINIQFTVVVNAKLTKPSGNFIEWHSNKVITQVEGAATQNHPIDDIFQVKGSANGKVQRDNLLVGWRSEITEPLYKKFACRWISKGRVRTIRETLSTNSQWVGILDYGPGPAPGVCDNLATLTINGTVYQITLH